MKKIVELIKKIKLPIVVILALVVVYLGFNFVKDKIIANNFFQKYDVLTVVGDDIFSDKEIQLNGKTIEKTEEGWTNVLPVPNSLNYILLTSSYSKGHDIKCGNTTIPKRVEVSNLGENEWCVKHNGKEIIAVSSAQYYHYDENDIVYERCLKSGYYEGVDGGMGYNACAEMGLFLNDKQIATTKEKTGINHLTGKQRLEDASSFNYHPSKKIGSSIIYSTTDGTYAYDIANQTTKQLSDNEQVNIEDVFLDKNGKTIFVTGQNKLYENAFFGVVEYDGKTYPNIYSADYIDGNFYALRIVSVENKEGSSLGKIITYELIKNGAKIENIEMDGITPYGYDIEAIQQFPLCDTDTIVCVYENGHYAYKKRVQIPDVYGYDFWAEEMVIDGEWRGDNIPNLIGRSKPIFENGKLKYLVHTSTMLGKGLYLVDFDKEWSYKSIYFQNGPKLLGDYQNRLLNVVAK